MNPERALVAELRQVLSRAPADSPVRLLSVGAGDSVSVERQLRNLRPFDLIDRVDIEPAQVQHQNLGQSWTCSVESMVDVASAEYDAVFANYVLEHVRDLRSAAAEIRRVLKPGGVFVATVPNPAAPEFRLARVTPTAFHRLVRRGRAWDTAYAFRTIDHLVAIFSAAGFQPKTCVFFPTVGRYLAGYRLLDKAGAVWDRAVRAWGVTRLMGGCCVVLVAAPTSPREAGT